MASDSGRAIRAQPMPASSLSLLMRAPDETITRCNERCDIHVGTAPRAHFVELYHSGRWKHYYSEEQFLARLREAIKLSERWAEIAPPPDEAPLEQDIAVVPHRTAA